MKCTCEYCEPIGRRRADGAVKRTLRQASALHAHALVSTLSCSNSSKQLTKAWSEGFAQFVRVELIT